jgi:hypothetical protein
VCLGGLRQKVMETEIREPSFTDTGEPLTEPHFDEESTVLSARPVVPLERVEPPRRVSRPWLFAGAVAAALLAGVIVTAFYYSRLLNHKNSWVGIDNAKISLGVEAVATNQPQTEKSSEVEGIPRVPANSDPDVRAAAPVRKRTVPADDGRASARQNPGRPQPRLVDVFEERPDPQTIRERRRAARLAEKARRQQQRENSVRSRDDLTRIREIFEGTRRP